MSEHGREQGRLAFGRALALAAVLAVALASGSPEEALAQGCANADALPGQVPPPETAKAVVCLVNQERANERLRPLKIKASLTLAAQRHTDRMLANDCFMHQCPGERDLLGRIRATRYLPCRCRWGVGENLAWGSAALGTPRALVEAWMESPEHRHNILNRKFRHIGLGIRPGSPHALELPASHTYTADFGYRKRLKRR